MDGGTDGVQRYLGGGTIDDHMQSSDMWDQTEAQQVEADCEFISDALNIIHVYLKRCVGWAAE